jgi:RNA polymerase sigma-70 factor (ECF subfamily)
MLYSGSFEQRFVLRLRPGLTRRLLELYCVFDEEQLLHGARELDLDILAQIHDCYYEAVYRYVHYRIGDRQIAEDAASEVFLRLLNALHNGKAPKSSLRGWLFGTAGHIVNDHYRARYRSKEEDREHNESHPANEAANPEYSLQRAWAHAELRTALAELTEDQQQVVTLRFGQGLSHRDVAQLMGKTEGAVKLLQLRALRSLRRLLEAT